MLYVLMFLKNTWAIWQDVAVWLIVGLVMAGLLKAFFPTGVLTRWLGGSGIGPVFRAALIGTPLPLCSCSVLPTAMQLRRSGASHGATASFLVATPENGADSIALSYVLLGPIMTLLRPLTAILSAVVTGLVVEFVSRLQRDGEHRSAQLGASVSCNCEGGCDNVSQGDAAAESGGRRGSVGIVGQAFIELLDDIAGWLFVGILLAALLETLVPPNTLAELGSGLPAMLVIAIISVPMYICATASTPLAASMLIAGMSPGTVLVFLLAGPATNLASAAILRRELGGHVTAAYLVGVVGSAIGCGLLVDVMLQGMDIQVVQHIDSAREIMPAWISLLAAVVLGLLAIVPLRALLWKPVSACCCRA